MNHFNKDIGKQYPKDNRLDTSGFLGKARLHQSKFRAEYLELDYDQYGNYLTRKDAELGYNFYDGFDIFKAVIKYRKYNQNLYANMLRSEHIPFNLFIPFIQNKILCKNIFNTFMNNNISSIDDIKIEYAPKPRKMYLNDMTSFDVYIKYTHIDNSIGIIGIEVKYTEREYFLKPNSTEEKKANDRLSIYYAVTEKCGIYRTEYIDRLKEDKYRQLWRNQILGESILQVDFDHFKHFTSITMFPQGNFHFVETCKEYMNFIQCNDYNFVPLVYEKYFNTCIQYCSDDLYRNWINYLIKRYIIV
jgi:hypothetical protein